MLSIFRDKSRSRDDFLPDSPQESLLNPSAAGGASSSAKRLESYLIRQARAADDFDALAGDSQETPRQKGQSSRGLVKRQASRCSSLLASGGGGGVGSGAGVPGQYRRNMEAVGEFEQVWGGGGGGREDDSVPLTKELSAEFNRDDIQCCCEIPVKLTYQKKS